MNRWQFSTRHLLVLTAIVSVVLAIAVRIPTFFRVVLAFTAPVLIVVAILQSANFATSDRRPRVALAAWCALGSFFALYSYAILWLGLRSVRPVPGGAIVLFCVMAGCCATCIVQAWRSYKLIGRSTAFVDSSREQAPASASETPGGESH
jgi:hypothetical protein